MILNIILICKSLFKSKILDYIKLCTVLKPKNQEKKQLDFLRKTYIGSSEFYNDIKARINKDKYTGQRIWNLVKYILVSKNIFTEDEMLVKIKKANKLAKAKFFNLVRKGNHGGVFEVLNQGGNSNDKQNNAKDLFDVF